MEVFNFTTSPTPAELQTVIADYYETLDPPLEYVLLVGDVNRGEDLQIPEFNRLQNPSYPTENDVSDWGYAYLDGDDFMPEIFLGRMPAGNLDEGLKATRRVITYEKTPFLVDRGDRWNDAVLVAGNYSEGGGRPLSPVATTQWVQEHMENDWDTDCHTFYWQEGFPNPGDISNPINEGCIFVTYRGWGNAEGWVQPPTSLQMWMC